MQTELKTLLACVLRVVGENADVKWLKTRTVGQLREILARRWRWSNRK